MTLLAGIELGGTKTIVVRGRAGSITDRVEFATVDPATTLAQTAAILMRWHSQAALAAIGIASFGPVRIDPHAADYGVILATPKPHWSDAAVVATIGAGLPVPIAIDTDVNAAALAEQRFGAARGCNAAVYITIGTGVGAGALVNGAPVHGLMHPEVGHLRLRRAVGDRFVGACRFHGDCIEGLISGPALAARFARHPATVDPHDPAWTPVAADLAELLVALLLAYSPQRIVIGGGVALKQPHILRAAIAAVPERLADYLSDIDMNKLDAIVVLAALGDDAGPHGALLVAERAAVSR